MKCDHTGGLASLRLDPAGGPPTCSQCSSRLTEEDCVRLVGELWEWIPKDDMLGRYLPASASVRVVTGAILDHQRSLKQARKGYFRGRIAKDDWYVQWSDNDGIPVKEVGPLRTFLRSAVPLIQPAIDFSKAMTMKTRGNPSDLAINQEQPFLSVRIESDRIDEDDIYYSLRVGWDRIVMLDRFVNSRMEPYPFLAHVYGPWSLVDIFEYLRSRLRRQALRSDSLYLDDTIDRAAKLKFVGHSRISDGYKVVTEEDGKRVTTFVHWDKTECPACTGSCAHELRLAWELFVRKRPGL